jgi:hypothetical protein
MAELSLCQTQRMKTSSITIVLCQSAPYFWPFRPTARPRSDLFVLLFVLRQHQLYAAMLKLRDESTRA